MLFSMTGYGLAKQALGDQTLVVEVKSINFKGIDIRIKTPFDLGEKEILLKKTITESAQRGKIDVKIEFLESMTGASGLINEELFKTYARNLNRLAKEMDLDPSQIIPALIRIPEVLASGTIPITDDVWQVVQSTMDTALDKFLSFRQEEGRSIEDDFLVHVGNIEKYLNQIMPFEEDRIEKFKERIQTSLLDSIPNEMIDQNRFEQELIYYLEKMDFNEEKSRLDQHNKYFREVLDSDEVSKGRSLNFIAQEMGREINTLGAKAYHGDIQKLVINMKDELEKIKEQTANIV